MARPRTFRTSYLDHNVHRVGLITQVKEAQTPGEEVMTGHLATGLPRTGRCMQSVKVKQQLKAAAKAVKEVKRRDATIAVSPDTMPETAEHPKVVVKVSRVKGGSMGKEVVRAIGAEVRQIKVVK